MKWTSMRSALLLFAGLALAAILGSELLAVVAGVAVVLVNVTVVWMRRDCDPGDPRSSRPHLTRKQRGDRRER